MSRIGKAPIKIEQGVKVKVDGRLVNVEGPKGKLAHSLPEGVAVKVEGDQIVVSRDEKFKKSNALQGTTRTVISNMVLGCHKGFTKEMDIVGVGYRAAVKGSNLALTLGFSHPVDFALPKEITAKVEKNTHLILQSPDKVLLGEISAKIRSLRPPEPYQGKGIRYSDERIIRKQGKAAAGAK